MRGSQRTVAIHGCEGNESVAYIGGSDDRLIELITESLEDIGISVREAHIIFLELKKIILLI